MALRLSIVLVLPPVLVNVMVHLTGLKKNATKTATVTGFTITVAIIETGGFAQMLKLMCTKVLEDARK